MTTFCGKTGETKLGPNFGRRPVAPCMTVKLPVPGLLSIGRQEYVMRLQHSLQDHVRSLCNRDFPGGGVFHVCAIILSILPIRHIPSVPT